MLTQVKSRSELEEKEGLVQSLCRLAKNHNFVDYVRVDCPYGESPSLTQLRTLILTTHDELQAAILKVSLHDHAFMSILCQSADIHQDYS